MILNSFTSKSSLTTHSCIRIWPRLLVVAPIVSPFPGAAVKRMPNLFIPPFTSLNFFHNFHLFIAMSYIMYDFLKSIICRRVSTEFLIWMSLFISRRSLKFFLRISQSLPSGLVLLFFSYFYAFYSFIWLHVWIVWGLWDPLSPSFLVLIVLHSLCLLIFSHGSYLL